MRAFRLSGSEGRVPQSSCSNVGVLSDGRRFNRGALVQLRAGWEAQVGNPFPLSLSARLSSLSRGGVFTQAREFLNSSPPSSPDTSTHARSGPVPPSVLVRAETEAAAGEKGRVGVPSGRTAPSLQRWEHQAAWLWAHGPPHLVQRALRQDLTSQDRGQPMDRDLSI